MDFKVNSKETQNKLPTAPLDYQPNNDLSQAYDRFCEILDKDERLKISQLNFQLCQFEQKFKYSTAFN